MGFLKKFFSNVFEEESAPSAQSSFERLSNDELEAHLGVARYGDFTLTDAVRPSYDLKVTPRQGYRHDVYCDEQNQAHMPVLMCSAREGQGHSDLYREHLDMPVLMSTLWDFEDLLTNDGCAGIAVLNPNVPQEVQFDEHKLLIVYGANLGEYERIMHSYNVDCHNSMKFITEAEHVHSSSDTYVDQFDQLRSRLGMDAAYDLS